MPRFRVKSPDGTTYEVNAPEGATQQDAIAYVQANAASIPKAETSFLRDVGGAAIRGAGSQVVGLPGVLYGLATGDMDNISTRAGKAVEEFGEELQTEAFRERQRQQAGRVAEAEKEGFLSGFGQQAKELLTDPLSLAAGAAQTLPALIGTGGAGLVGRAAATALARGQIARQATVEAAKEAAKKVAKRGTLAGTSVGSAALIGGDAAQSTYERVKQMPPEVVARSEPYQAAIAEGATPEEARESAAVSAARRSAGIAAPIAAVTGPFGLEAALLTGGLRRGVIRGGIEGFAREGGQEVIEETGQGLAENIGAQAIDPNVALTEGLGGRAGAGFILGGSMGGFGGAVSGLRGPEAEPEAEPGTEPPPPAGEPEPETGVPATSFGTPSVSEAPPAGPAGPTVTIDAEEVIIEQPDGSFQVIPRAEWEATQGPAPAPVAVAEPAPAPAPAPTPKIFGEDDTEGLPPVRAEAEPAPTPATAPVSKIFQPSGQPAPEATTAPPPPSDTSRIFNPRAPEPVRVSMPPYVRPPEFKVGRPAREPAPAPTPVPEAYAPILQEYQAIVEKPTLEATDRLKASTVRDIPMQGSNMTMSVVQAPDGALLALPGRDMIRGWQRQLQGELAKDLRSQTIDQFYDYEGLEVPLQVTRPAVVDASGTVIQRGILGKAPAARASAPSPAPAPAPTPAAPAPAKPPRAQKLPAPKAANTMQAYIAQIAKTFKKGQDRYSFESAVYHGVDPDWLNSRADLRRMFGKEKLTRGRDGKVIQNRRQIDENLKDFADLAMGFQPKDWGLYGEALDENGYVTPEALADLINRDAPRYDPTTGRPYEQEVQEEDYGFEATVQAVSREASDLGVDLTDADMRAIAERIGADGDPAQGIVDYVNEKFEGLMAEARDYSEYDAGQEEFPDGPVTNIEDRTAEPGIGGQAAAPGDTGRGQTDREQPAGTAPGTQEGSLGLETAQAVPSGGMTERQRAEMQARLQQSQMRRGNQEAFDQQEGGMFDASRDQDGLFKNVPDASRRPDLVEEPRNTDIAALVEELPEADRVNVRARLDRITENYAKNGDVERLLGSLEELRKDVDRRIYRNQAKRARPLVRGFERAMEVLYRAERDGLLTPESAALARWLIQRNPRIADDLAFSFQAGDENSPAGDYNSITRVARIFAGGVDGLTAAHEILHHTERMMPEQIREGIRAAWRNRIDSLMEMANRTNNVEMRRVLGAIVQAYYGNEQAQRELAEAFREGSIPYSVYHLSNPSEFWAVNASELLSDRASRAGWVGAARNWLRDFIEAAKDFFGLPNNAAVLRGLRAVLAAESGVMTGDMLANQAVVSNINAQPSTPQQPPSGPQQSLFPPSQLPPSLTLPKETRGQRYSRKLVDRFERLRVVQSLGQLAAGIEGFYEAARKFDSRAGELMAKFNRDYFQPIEKIMKEAGLSLETVDAYLYARAAPDRNARLKAKAENEIRTKMYNKIISEMEADGATEAEIQTAIIDADADVQAAIAKAAADGKIPESGSGMTDQEADRIMNGYRGENYFPALERIGEIFNRANKERMENNIQRGLVSREIGEQLLRDEPNYVPMKGSIVDENLTEPAEDFEDVMGYGGSGFGVSVREWYDTRGRTSLGFSPLGTFVSDVGTSIVRGERNRVGQKLMTFFIDNPSESWKVFSYRNPPRNRNGDIQRPSPFDPNFMVVKRGGETFYLRIDDPLLAKAAKNLNPTQMNAFLRISSNLTRILARSLTTVNPDFFLPNFFRDLESAALNLGADSPGLLKAFSKFVKDKKAIRSVAAFEYGNKGGDPALRDLYEQFKLDGGSVSWVERETPQEAAARIQKDLKTVNDSLKDLKDARSAKEAIDAVWNPTSKGFRAMVGALESTNATFENSIRFAAYRAALDVGMTREQAATIARESTVDFNRRGEAGAMLNALYVFFNAGIQGTVRTARALSNNPFKTGKLSITQAALLSAMATAATLAAANAGISGEDDDGKLHWDKIPDYEKQRNLIIMNPLDGKTYAKIPMPYGFGFFPYLATRTMDAARTGEDLGAVGLEIMSAGLSNFSPIQFSAGSIQSSVAKAITPTLGRPFVELMLNENFMAKPIYNEPFDKGQSYASVARFNTPEGYKELSQFLNDISEGEGKVKGGVNFPAESFEYLVDFALGGVGNLAKALYKTGEEGDVMAAPVVKRLVGQPGKGRNVGEYYEREEKARSVNQQMKDLTGAERAVLKKKFPVETSPRVQSALTSARSEVVRLNKEYKRIQNMDIDEGAKAQRLERLREQIDGAFVRFNRVYNQVEQATR